MAMTILPASDASATSREPRARNIWLGAIAIFLMTCVAYLPAMNGQFIWDDDQYITENITLRTWAGLYHIWFDLGATPQYYPMVFTTFWIECRLWGIEPVAFHLGNVLLHALGAILAWRVLRRLRVPGAWLAGAIFALHPVEVESVAWITERKNVLSGALYLASMLTYLRFTGVEQLRNEPMASRWGVYALSLALFAAALLSKTTACTLPAALVLLLWWKRARLSVRDLAPLVPFFIMGIGLGLLTAWFEREHVRAAGPDWDFSLLDRCLIAGRAFWSYLSKLAWPAPLMMVYPRWTIDDQVWWHYVYPMSAVALGLSLLLLRKRIGKGPFVAAAFFAGTLFPALGFFNVYPMLFSFVADHFQYLASLGPIALVAALATMATRHVHRLVRCTMAVLLLGVLGALAWKQCHVYTSRFALWSDTVRKNPEAWVAHGNLAVELVHTGDFAAALRHAQRSLELRPQGYRAYNTMAMALEGLGQVDEAIENYRRAISLDPNTREAYLNLAGALHARGDLDGAEQVLREAMKAHPEYGGPWHNLAVVQLARNQLAAAMVSGQQALRRDPYNADTHYLMGILLLRANNRDQAIAHLTAAVQLNPQHDRARQELRRLLPR
jgi:Flp pilus assembly protein TadD